MSSVQIAVAVLLVFTALSYAQRPAARNATGAATITGIVIEYEIGAHGDTTVVEAGGKTYTFCLGCPGKIKDSPQIIGDQDIKVGTRVKVDYVGAKWSAASKTYDVKAVRVTNLKGTSGNVATNPEQGDWATFWPAFRAALQQRDRAAIRSMISAGFEWAGDGQVNSAQVIRNMDTGLVPWQRILKSVTGGVVNCRPKDSSCWNFSGRQAKRTIKPETLVFELGTDARWKWARLVGD
ncbi:MAG: hypothetical protein HYR56_03770 [Acidobacteria bacterium]|nr:hypothetical protein [Acidobacteriota bacterium]MBI3426850.1 hypothetical protein [Acidobacteriota bacterium]